MTEKRTIGILRRDTPTQPVVDRYDADLLVFGYQSKIYRDDAKATWIDQGKHLIPCPSNTSLKVDRYDVRGALGDLSKYEAPPGGYDDRLEHLSPAERRAEELCEEERYWSLYNHDEEFYQDSNDGTGSNGAQIGFNYDTPTQSGDTPKPDDEEDSITEPFVAPRNFFIPPNLVVPETMKQQAVIEKTARFIASQGVQMEILLKAKQSNNPLFAFLLHADSLNPYYKHMLEAIKGGNYPAEEDKDKEEPTTVEPEQSASEINFEPRAIPVAKYAPSQDCIYFKLMNTISKISGLPPPMQSTNGDEENSNQEAPAVTSSGLRGLVEYNSDSETEEDEANNGEVAPENSLSKPVVTNNENLKPTVPSLSFTGILPPQQILHIIDKTATYVNKNGADFENILRCKSDPRFVFLEPGHKFYAYYYYKLKGVNLPENFKPTPPTVSNVTKSSIVQNLPNSGPVSFSIKTKEEAPPPQNSKRPQLNNSSDNSSSESESSEQLSKYDIAGVIEDEQLAKKQQIEPEQKIQAAKVSMTPELEEKLKEARRANERIRDRLAAVAREKLNALSREKQLQLERKKRAIAFLRNIKKTGGDVEDTKKSEKPKHSGPTAALLDIQKVMESSKVPPSAPSIGPIYDNDSDVSIHSVPSSSPPPPPSVLSDEPPQVISSDSDVQEVEVRSKVVDDKRDAKQSNHHHRRKESKKKSSKSKKSYKRKRSRTRSSSTSSSSSTDSSSSGRSYRNRRTKSRSRSRHRSKRKKYSSRRS